MAKKRRKVADGAVRLLFITAERLRLLLGRRFGLIFGRLLGTLAYLVFRFDGKRMDDMRANLSRMLPDASDAELNHLVADCFRHWGTFLLEGFGIPQLSAGPEDEWMEVVGLEHLDDALKGGKGAILATAHFGHFELANSWLAMKGYPVSSVIRTVDDPWLDENLDRVRTYTGSVTIPKESAAREIIRALRNGRVVAINVDQNAAFNHLFVPFFDELAATFTTPATIGLRTGSPILSFLCARDPVTHRYRAEFSPVTPPETGDRGADIRYVTTRLARSLEEAIRRAPAQWLWIHRRWKTRPDPEDIAAVERESALLSAKLGGTWNAPADRP